MKLIKSLIKLVRKEKTINYALCLDHRTWLSRQVQEGQINETLRLQLNKQSLKTMDTESRKRAKLDAINSNTSNTLPPLSGTTNEWYKRYI